MLRYWSTDWRVPVRIREFFSSTATSVVFFLFLFVFDWGAWVGAFLSAQIACIVFYYF